MKLPFPGCRLSARRDAELRAEDKAVLRRLGIDRQTIVYVTYVDATGVSVYVKRIGASDLHVFIPHGGMTTWMTFFEVGTPFGDAAGRAYVGSRHAVDRFPFR